MSVRCELHMVTLLSIVQQSEIVHGRSAKINLFVLLLRSVHHHRLERVIVPLLHIQAFTFLN